MLSVKICGAHQPAAQLLSRHHTWKRLRKPRPGHVEPQGHSTGTCNAQVQPGLRRMCGGQRPCAACLEELHLLIAFLALQLLLRVQPRLHSRG